MGYVTGHCQVFNRAAFYSTEQTGIPEFGRNVQAGNGVAAAVKCALVENLICSGIVSDRRPRFVIQINVFRQHGADFGFFFGFCIIHLIPEPFQPLGGGNLIGVVLRAAAGGKRGGAGDRTVEYQYGFSP